MNIFATAVIYVTSCKHLDPGSLYSLVPHSMFSLYIWNIYQTVSDWYPAPTKYMIKYVITCMDGNKDHGYYHTVHDNAYIILGYSSTHLTQLTPGLNFCHPFIGATRKPLRKWISFMFHIIYPLPWYLFSMGLLKVQGLCQGWLLWASKRCAPPPFWQREVLLCSSN